MLVRGDVMQYLVTISGGAINSGENSAADKFTKSDRLKQTMLPVGKVFWMPMLGLDFEKIFELFKFRKDT